MTLKVTLLVKELDRLIDWYDSERHDVGYGIHVPMNIEQCREFAQEAGDTFTYRGRTIIPKPKK